MLQHCKKYFKKTFYTAGAAFTLGSMTSSSALAQNTSGENFGDISQNIVDSISDLPGFISALSYLSGTLLGVLGILKLKDHVEQPQQNPLKEGAIRLAAGGGLFALPLVYEAMFTTVGEETTAVNSATLQGVGFNVAP